MDLDGNGSFETNLFFFRLFGDTTGDQEVTAADQSALLVGADGSLLEPPVAAVSLTSVARALSPTTAPAVPATPMSGWLLSIFPFPARAAAPDPLLPLDRRGVRGN